MKIVVKNMSKMACLCCWMINTNHCTSHSTIYRVSQEEMTKLRESVPYVELYRYNPKHLYPKLNGYGDNGQRKVLTSCISAYCTSSAVAHWPWQSNAVGISVTAQAPPNAILPDIHALCTVLGNPKDNHDMSASVFVVQYNGFMSLKSYFDVKYRY